MPLMQRKGWVRIGVVAMLIAAGGTGITFWKTRHNGVHLTNLAAGAAPESETPGGAEDISVKVIHPKADPSFKLTVSQPAYVEAYYRVNLQARVAGPISYLVKAIGSRVTKGEKLLTIDVPDLEADMFEKAAIIEQRKGELFVAAKMIDGAAADVETARAAVKEKEAELDVARATEEFRRQELARFRGLGDTVSANIVAEREKFWRAGVAAVHGAEAAITKAKADVKGAEAKLEQAKADKMLKEKNIVVAERVHQRAQATYSFHELKAPFTGVITDRRVDPNSFVRSSENGQGDTLLTVERTDIMTIHMNLPDNYVRFVDRNTDAIIELTELPGVQVLAKVTRTSDSLLTPDHTRTMRVEVDVYNQDEKSYKEFLAKEKEKKTPYDDLKDGAIPLLPKITGKTDGLSGRLCSGMYGKMKLVLRKFANAHLIPSSAMFSKGGKPYIYLVKDGKALLTPVEVQVDDGNLALVSKIETVGHDHVKSDLTGDEVIVLTNQAELSDGQPVQTTLADW